MEHINDRPQLAGIILAGGLSTRMGTDKALLNIGGKPLLGRITEQMLAAGIPSVTVAARDEGRQEQYRRALAELAGHVDFVPDVYPGCGPLAGLHAAMSKLPGGFAFVMACDMPVLSVPLLQRMAEAASQKPAAESMPAPDVIRTPEQPFHAIYHSRIAEQLRPRLEQGDYRVMRMLDTLPTRFVHSTQEEEEAFVNLNSPEVYESYIRRFISRP
ncbi:molybdenum cofactor guanylyltransferase [Paenibacillus mendelii]|uniref:Probable molybdenum cofactor guanylyltransferase n=1 Tax=Paenibacillus mendelii TaxID=206163 RepID=A0ABV6J3S4_9BACL|nr:molybdenum cofactor guanylyltransferase [Paenibacillus mendelii]MCQ6561986.1 molybdenum cofactor guanylyltransferase [Paenibacillus mendelii]